MHLGRDQGDQQALQLRLMISSAVIEVSLDANTVVSSVEAVAFILVP